MEGLLTLVLHSLSASRSWNNHNKPPKRFTHTPASDFNCTNDIPPHCTNSNLKQSVPETTTLCCFFISCPPSCTEYSGFHITSGECGPRGHVADTANRTPHSLLPFSSADGRLLHKMGEAMGSLPSKSFRPSAPSPSNNIPAPFAIWAPDAGAFEGGP